mmetsp:Transcript_796/g.1630  ORF Transcript_796/g.1630 Transcript_796/m.1630 type:complete len:216 (+) Transcript_796:943-1590(+)
MDHLVVSALHERRVDAAEGLQALARHSRGEGHGVLLGDSNVERALGESPSKDVHSGTAGHCGGDPNNFAVFGRRVDECVGENRGEGRRGGLALELDPRLDIEFAHAVHPVGCLQGRFITVPLGGLEVEQDRLVGVGVTQLLEDRDHVLEIMPIDRTDVEEAQFLEERATGHDTSGVLVNPLVDILHVLGEELVEALGKVSEVLEGLRDEEIGRVG